MKYVYPLTAILALSTATAVYAEAAPASPPMLALPSEPAEPAPTAVTRAKPKSVPTSAFTPVAPVEASPSAGPETAPAPVAAPFEPPPVEAAAPVVALPGEPVPPAVAPTPVTVPAATPAVVEPTPEPAAAEPAPAEPAPVVEAPKPKPKPKAKPKPAPVAKPAVPIEPFGSEGSGAIPALPLEIMTNGNVTYVTGGIGDEEMEMLKARESEFNVQLLLSSTNGEYIGGVMVRVLNEQGVEVVSVNDAGPYLYAKLPPGKYTLEGTATQGGIKSVKVNAPASGYTKAHIVYIE